MIKIGENAPQYFTEYVKAINNGSIVIGKDMHKALILLNNKYEKYGADESYSQRAINWIEKYYTLGQGQVKIMLWQKVVIEAFYALRNPETGGRLTKTLFLLVGRGNAKTKLVSMITTFELMVGNVPNKEMLVISEARKLAERMYSDVSKQFTSVYAPRQMKLAYREHDIIRKDYLKQIYVNPNAKHLKTIGSSFTVATKSEVDGGREYMINLDELHYFTEKSILEDLRKGLQKDEAGDDNWALTVATTQGDVREGAIDFEIDYIEQILDGDIEDDTYLPFLYRQDSKEEIADPDTWQKANPALGVSITSEFIEKEIKRAKGDPVVFANLMQKRFNLIHTASTAFFNIEQFKKSADKYIPVKDEPVLIGIDGALTGDLTAVSFGGYDGNLWRFDYKYILPRHTYLEVPEKYRAIYAQAVDNGELILHDDSKTGGQVVFDVIQDHIHENGLEPLGFMYDPAYLQEAVYMLKQEWGENKVRPMYQNGRSQHTALKQTKQYIYEGRLTFNSAFTLWQFQNVLVKTRNGEFKLLKDTASEKIDGVASTLDVVQGFTTFRSEYEDKFDGQLIEQVSEAWRRMYDILGD